MNRCVLEIILSLSAQAFSFQVRPWFSSQLGPSVCYLHVLPLFAWVSPGTLMSSHSPVMSRLNGICILPLGVHVYLCSPATEWRAVEGIPRLRPAVCWLQQSCDPKGIRWVLKMMEV